MTGILENKKINFGGNIMKRILGNKGFTLIELIVVIVILAVLAMIAVPSVTGYIRTSRLNTANANIQAIVAVMNRQYSENGSIVAPATTDLPKGVTITPLAAQPTYTLDIDISQYNLIDTDGTVSTALAPDAGNFKAIKGVHPNYDAGTNKITYTPLDASK